MSSSLPPPFLIPYELKPMCHSILPDCVQKQLSLGMEEGVKEGRKEGRKSRKE
jgi:hypothetical protein